MKMMIMMTMKGINDGDDEDVDDDSETTGNTRKIFLEKMVENFSKLIKLFKKKK